MKKHALAIFSAFAAASALAANIYWNGKAGDSDWFNVENWKGASGEAFNPADYRILFESPNEAIVGKTVTFTSAAEHTGSENIDFRQSAADPIAWKVTDPAYGLSAPNAPLCADKTGVLTIEGGTYEFLRVLVGASLDSADYDSTITFSNASVAAGLSDTAVGAKGASTGRLNVRGGTFDFGGKLLLGNATNGKGYMTVTESAKVTTTNEIRVACGSSGFGSLLVTDGGSISTTLYLGIGNGKGSYGVVTNDGGTVTAPRLYLAKISSGGGESARAEYVNKSGSTSIGASGVQIGHGGGSRSLLRVEGGEVSVAGGIDMSYGGSTTGIVEVAGGTLSAKGEATFGSNWDNGCGTLNIVGGTTTFEGGLNFKYAHAGDSGAVNVTGGVLAIPFAKVGSGGAYSLALDGGTLRATSPSAAFLPASSYFTASIGSNGGTIDTAGNNVTVATAITGSGTLTKTGGGVLTFTDLSNFSGAIEIIGGSVVVPSGYTYPNGLIVGNGVVCEYSEAITGSITVHEGGKLILDFGDKADGTYDLPTNVTLPGGADPADYYLVYTGRATTEDFGTSGKVTIATASDGVTTMWVGIGDNSAWTNVNNWTHGVPRLQDTALIANDAEIYGYGSDKYEFGTLEIENDASFKYVSGDTYRNNPTIAPTNVVGTGKIILYCTEISVQDGCPITIPSTIPVITWTQNWYNHQKKFSKITGKDGALITVYSTVTSPFGGVHSSGDTNTYEFQNPFRANFATFNGDIVIESVTEIHDSHYDWCTRFENCTINGDISGSGSVAFNNGVTLNGDNSAFTGYAVVNATGEVGIGNSNAGSANARWSIRGGFSFTKDAIAENSVFHLGSVTNFNMGLSGEKGGLAFKMDANQPKLTVEIGALGEDMDLCAYTNQGVRVRSSENFVIKKVGAGTFKTSVYGCRNWIVSEGTLEFAEVPVAEGIDLNLDSNAQAYKYIDKITVCSNAVLRGVVTPEAVAYVGEVIYEDGALVGLDYENGAFVADALGATVNKYTVNGAVLSVAESARDAFAACNVNTSITLLTAANEISAGSSMQDIVVSTKGGKPQLVWQSRIAGKSLVTRLRNLAAGFSISLR